MEMLRCCFVTALALISTASSAPTSTATVALSYATVLGNVKDNVESFGGIPYAEPPINNLRLRPPQRLTRSIGTFDGTGPAGACPQMVMSSDVNDFLHSIIGNTANLPFIQQAAGESEDCLTITVARPSGTQAGDSLPVLYWIYGGGYQVGWSSMYDGSSLVIDGVSLDQPFVFVAVNYRVAGFGFLPGREMLEDGASNIGLLDQRMGLEWVADNIADFGGDPERVTIWGESAGAWSVFNQLALYDGNHLYQGKPLFHGAILSSGSILPAEPMDSAKAQAVYDAVVESSNCAESSDTLQCLRSLSYTDFLNAATSVPAMLSYSSLALSYLPRPDGKVFSESPEDLAKQGKYAAVPMILGGQQDEGTLFGLFASNVTDSTKLFDYFYRLYYPTASPNKLREVIESYPESPEAGSPYQTGILNEIFPGFKRLASLTGDLLFTMMGRLFLNSASLINPKVPAWSYIATYDRGTPVLGTFHGGDLLQVFFGIKDNYAAASIRSYFISFVNHLDPNNITDPEYPAWPQWDEGQLIMQFDANEAGAVSGGFRSDNYDVIAKNTDSLRQ